MAGFGYPRGNHKNVYILSALLSCSLSFLVILTCALFPRLRKKLFMRIITFISLCDFIANSTVLSGNPSERSLCVLQGVLQQYFYPASWLWTSLLTYLLYSLVVKGKITMPPNTMHAICWGLPLLFTLLPLSTGTYGQNVDDDDWCWIKSHSESNSSKAWTTFWVILTFEGLIYVCFLLMLMWYGLIYYKLTVQHIQCTPTVYSALQTLLFYPVILLITWFPNAIVLISDVEQDADSAMMVTINSLSIWQGGLTAILFFVNSKESRANWYELLRYFFPSLLPPRRGTSKRPERDTILRETPSIDGAGSAQNSLSASSSGTAWGRISNLNVHVSVSFDVEFEDFASDDFYYGRDGGSSLNSNASHDDNPFRGNAPGEGILLSTRASTTNMLHTSAIQSERESNEMGIFG